MVEDKLYEVTLPSMTSGNSVDGGHMRIKTYSTRYN